MPSGGAVTILLFLVTASLPVLSDGEDGAVRHRQRSFRHNLELSLLFTPSVLDHFVHHVGGMAAVTWHINDLVALELVAGYASMTEAAIVAGDAGVRARIGGTREPQLRGLLGAS